MVDRLISTPVRASMISHNAVRSLCTRLPGSGKPSRAQSSGNNWIALLGLFFHYFIAFSFTLLFFLVFPRIKFLRYDKYLAGMLYGVFVNLFFNQVVLPLFPPPRWQFSVARSFIDWVIFGVIFGIPIAYNAYRYYLTPPSGSSQGWPMQGKI